MAETVPPTTNNPIDRIEFFWDPVCPFAWITSRWVAEVARQSGLPVRWRCISLRLLNREKDYAADFPPEYEQGHTAGLRILRVVAAVRQAHGDQPLDKLVGAFGASWWDLDPAQAEAQGGRRYLSTPDHVRGVLATTGLDDRFLTALDDPSWDDELFAETEEALSRTGRDVGTPIITFYRSDGTSVSFFGPVISRIPTPEEALPLWEAVTTLAEFPGFSELKRSLRDKPQLRVTGNAGSAETEDWSGGRVQP